MCVYKNFQRSDFKAKQPQLYFVLYQLNGAAVKHTGGVFEAIGIVRYVKNIAAGLGVGVQLLFL